MTHALLLIRLGAGSAAAGGARLARVSYNVIASHIPEGFSATETAEVRLTLYFVELTLVERVCG